MYHYGYSVHVKINNYVITNNRSIIFIITLLNIQIMTFEELHVIDNMIYSHDIEKWVTIEEYYQEYNSPLNIKLKKYGKSIFK